MKLFFNLCLLLLIPGLLLRLNLGGTGILATDIILPIFAAIWIFQKLLIYRNFPKATFIVPGVIFLIIAILSFLVGAGELVTNQQLISGAHILRFTSLLIFAYAAVDLFKTKKEKEQLLQNIFKITGAIIILGFAQFYFLPDLSTYSTEGGWDPHIGRLFGTWMDPNFMAGFLGFMLPITISTWYQTKSTKQKHWLALLIIATIIALFLTFSRSGYLAAMVGLIIFFIIRDPKILLIGAILLILAITLNERAQKRTEALIGTVSAIILQDTDEIDPTASLRIKSWQKSYELFEKYPLTGIGFNTYRYRAAEEGIVDETYFSAGGADSTLLTILVTTGIPGFLAFTWFYIGLIYKATKKYFSTSRRTGFVTPSMTFQTKGGEEYLGLAAALTALLIHSLFINSLLFPLILMPVLTITGIILSEKK